MYKRMTPVLLATLLTGCLGYNDVDNSPPIPSAWTRPANSSPHVTVYYVTDRARDQTTVSPRTGKPLPRKGGFGESWSSDATCGAFSVTLTQGDTNITAPVVQASDCTPPDPEPTTATAAANAAIGTPQSFAATLAAPGMPRCVLIYIQGFNSTFDTAVQRTGQMALDTQTACTPLAFSWASAGQVDRYVSDVEHSSYSASLLRALLLALNTHGLRIDIVAHSMGTRLMMQTLATIRQPCRTSPLVHELVLAAPDIGAEHGNDDFQTLYGAAQRCIRRTTIYISQYDTVLAVSQALHGGVAREGRNPPNDVRQSAPVRADGFDAGTMDLIDASAAPGDPMGHGYYAASWEAVEDIMLALRDVPSFARARGGNGAWQTLGCGPIGEDVCDPRAPRYRLAIQKPRAQHPNWLMQRLHGWIPLRPGG